MKKTISYFGRIKIFTAFTGSVLLGVSLMTACKKERNSNESSTEKIHLQHKVDLSIDNPSEGNKAEILRNSSIADLQELDLRIRAASLNDAEQLIANLESLTARHPSQCLQFADALPPGVKRDLALRIVFSSYPKNSYEELFRWADSSDYKEDKELVKLILNPGGASIPIQKAIELRNSLKSVEIKYDLLDFVGISIGGKEDSTFDDIYELSLEFPAEDRARLIDQFGYGVLQLDLGKAIDLIHRYPDSFGHGFIATASKDAGLNAPNQYQEKIVSSANRLGGDLVLRSFVQGWLSNNSIEATQWVVSSLNGRMSDVGKMEIARFLVLKGDRNGAKAYIDTINDKSLLQELDSL